MTLQEINDFCSGLDDAYCDFPFGDDTLVFRHEGSHKIFIFFMNHFSDSDIALKGSPIKNIILRQTNSGIVAAYHLHKKHWNSVLTKLVDDELIKQMILESWQLTK